MKVSVLIKPGVSPDDRFDLEDLVCSALDKAFGIETGCLGGGTLMKEDVLLQSDFVLELESTDTAKALATCREVLGGVPFALDTEITLHIDELDPVVLKIQGKAPES